MTDDLTVGILAYDGVDAVATVGLREGLSVAAKAGCGISPTIYSLVPSNGITSPSGFEFVPDDVLIGTPDVVVVPGGATREGKSTVSTVPDDLSERIAQLHDAGATVVGIGTGVLTLGQADLLEGRPATTREPFVDVLARSAGEVVDEPLVDDGDVVTVRCSGNATDLARHLVEDQCGGDAAAAIDDSFGF